jgi:hypothetical protein
LKQLLKKIMKRPHHLSLLTRGSLALLVAFSLALPALKIHAAGTSDASSNPQLRFNSPNDAMTALKSAAEAGDRATIDKIFGPDVKDFFTGDVVQDNANFKGFSEAMSAGCTAEPQGNDQVILDIGTNNWPFPIPLVKQSDGQWLFDTAAGRDEIIDRHIGRDELNAIGFCRAYVTAQNEYFSKPRDDSGVQKYALKFKSSPGEKDGLYWKSLAGSSPFNAVVTEAHAEGYGNHPAGTGPHPFHGYLFRILTAQGRSAPGGRMDYLTDGNLTHGFALVAYPDKWGKSGVMTFIVNQDGKVYQRNLGEKTVSIASTVTEYNPDRHWTLVDDEGVSEP